MCRGLWDGFPGWSVRVRNGAYFSFRVFIASAPGGEDVPEHSWNRRSQEAAGGGHRRSDEAGCGVTDPTVWHRLGRTAPSVGLAVPVRGGGGVLQLGADVELRAAGEMR